MRICQPTMLSEFIQNERFVFVVKNNSSGRWRRSEGDRIGTIDIPCEIRIEYLQIVLKKIEYANGAEREYIKIMYIFC